MAEGAERPAVEAFEERCVEATVRLTHAMSPTVVLLVQALDCPVAIWKRLERQYEKRTAASKLSLVQKYFGAKMAEGESAEKHLLNMGELCDRLAAMELPVPEEFQPLMILASLPSSYTAIVQTLGSQAGKLDLSHVTSTIMDEEAWRRNNGGHATDTKPSSAMEDNRTETQPDVFSATTAKSWGTSAETVRSHRENTANSQHQPSEEVEADRRTVSRFRTESLIIKRGWPSLKTRKRDPSRFVSAPA